MMFMIELLVRFGWNVLSMGPCRCSVRGADDARRVRVDTHRDVVDRSTSQVRDSVCVEERDPPARQCNSAIVHGAL